MGGAGLSIVRAAVPDNQNVIHACYSSTSAVRIIDSANTVCNSGESSIEWSQHGNTPIAQGSNLNNLQLVYRDLSNENLSGVQFQAAYLTGTSFKGSNLSNADFTSSQGAYLNFSGANLLTTTFDLVRYNFSKLRNINLSGHIFTGGSISDSDFKGAKLVGMVMSNVDFFRSDFTNADLSNSTFTQNVNFFGATFGGANLTGVSWGASTTCPDGGISGYNGATCIGHLLP